MISPARALGLFAAVVVVAALSGCSTATDEEEGDQPPDPADPQATTAGRQPSGAVSSATVTGPVSGGIHGFPQTSAAVDLEAAGYVEEEYLLTGVASAYEPSGTWSADGRWSVTEASTAPYTTRLLVRRPADASEFNGTVVVEWLNVSSLVDLDPDFSFASEEILRGGYAWVGVSAQAAGVNSTGGSPFGESAVGLRAWDPPRYGSLEHPGDAYSYDIFSQAGNALVAGDGAAPLGELRPQRLIADGESQAAYRMFTYVNAIHGPAGVYDGFLIHSRNGTGAPLGEGMNGGVPAPARVRTDSTAPVFQVITETDLFSLRGNEAPFPDARQPDSDFVHTWELAGTAHADASYLEALMIQGRRQFEGFLDLDAVLPTVNNAPQRYSMNAALRALDDWVRGVGGPPGAPPIEVDAEAIVRDINGNAVGGLRLPQMEVPIATLSGEGPIPLSGSAVPFDDATLAELYADHDAYVEAVSEAAGRSVAAGYLLAEDAEALVAEATASSIGA